MTDRVDTGRGSLLSQGLVWGFATSVAMWVVAFLGHWPTLGIPVAVLGPVLLLCQVVGAAAARSAGGGAVAGGVTGVLNLLVLGSVLTEAETAPSGEVTAQGAVPGAILYVSGYLAASVLLGALGGLLGSRTAKRNPLGSSPDWLARFGVVTALAIVPLLAIGGLVTSTNSGLAVPGWPDSYGANMFLYPLREMTAQNDRFLEHSHRLMGSLVGLATLVLLVWTIWREPRGWVKGMAAGLFILVCLQGYIGGLRVNNKSAALATMHGFGSQLTFAMAVALAVVLASQFRTAIATRIPAVGAKVAWAAVITLLFQVAFGAMYRHMDSRHALYSHVVFSILPAVLALIVGSRAAKWKGGSKAETFAAQAGKGLMHATLLQMVLGLAAFWVALMLSQKRAPSDPLRVVTGTLHQLNGALVLATATLAAVMVARLAWTWKHGGSAAAATGAGEAGKATTTA